jgi:ribosomal RNA-processing protein 9
METPDEKRRRIAKSYLQQVASNQEDNEEQIAEKLRTERLSREGRLYEDLSQTFANVKLKDVTHHNYNGHHGTITCLALSDNNTHIYTGGKDNAVICFDTETGKREILKAAWSRSSESLSHEGEILALAVSSDGRFVAAGGRDCVVRLFDRRSRDTEVQTLRGHNGPVSALSFQTGSHALFSGSHDRTVKYWEAGSGAYVETQFGHQVNIVFVLLMSLPA